MTNEEDKTFENEAGPTGPMVQISLKEYDKLKERADKIDDVRLELTREIQSIEKRLLIEIKNIRIDIGQRVGVLEKYRWIIFGAILAAGWILSMNFAEIVQLLK